VFWIEMIAAVMAGIMISISPKLFKSRNLDFSVSRGTKTKTKEK